MLQRTMMDNVMRLLVLVLLLLCWESASSQDSVVEGFVGGNIILPCSYTPLDKVNVFWRDSSSKVVLDIINGVESQSKMYKGRVSSFPQEYNKGNFSIILNKLQQNDTNTYECFIADVDVQRSIKLKVSATPSGAAGTNVLHVVLLIVLTLLL